MTRLQVRFGTEVLHKIRCYPSLVAVCLVVKVYHVALGEELCWIRAEVPDGVDVRECLHTEFAIESAAKCIKNLVLLLGTMPDIPLMHISNCSIGSL